MKLFLPLALALPLTFSSAMATPWKDHGPLKISENKRFLVHADNTPFFWLADTGWEMLHRLNREEANHYLTQRAANGFNVIQTVALAEFDGLHAPNAYGFTPLVEDDPARPDVKDGPDNDYWDHVDALVDKVAELGMVTGFLPTWGDKWNPAWAKDSKVVFTPENAAVYGEWLGARYKDKPLVWILGGDRPADEPVQREIIKRMAEGLRKGDGGAHLITFHPTGGRGSAEWFHSEPWLDFNMRQNGHELEYTGRYDKTAEDYRREPVKPVLDAEPAYEDHPIAFKGDRLGYVVAADVRRFFYWDVFDGACGHTYGNHAVWQMFDPAKNPSVNNPLLPWREAIEQPGALQMKHGRRLMESRPYLTRIPDDSLIVPAAVDMAVPGAGTRRFKGTRDSDGSYAMIYTPVGRPFEVKHGLVKGDRLRVWWFNPRTGKADVAGDIPNVAPLRFTPPDRGELTDWVLVLDDVSKGYGRPGE